MGSPLGPKAHGSAASMDFVAAGATMNCVADGCAKGVPMQCILGDNAVAPYAKACGGVLARAHAKAGGVSEISGYLGGGDEFDTAMGAFGIAYADQAERDHAALKTAVRKGLVEVFR